MLTATAMSFFEQEITRAVVLALFIPLIISSGGNSGSQAATLVIRAMALGEVRLRQWWRVLRRELASGLVLGALLCTIGIVRIFGAVWPHDNAMIARYGLTREVLTLVQGLFEAAMYFELHRMPELFCGFSREPGEGPVLYPLACAPLSWAAASAFLLLQSSLGLRIDGVAGRISLRPALPPFLNDLEIRNLRVGAASLDLHLTRHGDDANVKVVRRAGDVEILVSQ
jgi:hypothetical protein